MRVAWFSPLPPVRSGIAAYSAELLPRLDGGFEVDAFVDRPASRAAARTRHESAAFDAHDFVWMHRRRPYDLIVYQLGNAPCHDYIWAYLVRYPGLVVLHDACLHHARARHLLEQQRFGDYRREFAYDHPDAVQDFAEYAIEGLSGSIYYFWPMVKAVAATARLLAVHNPRVAAALRDQFPGAAVDVIRMGVAAAPPAAAQAQGRSRVRRALNIDERAIVFAAFGKVTAEKRISAIVRALAALTAGGVNAHLLLVGDTDDSRRLTAELARRDVAGRVHITGYVPDDAIGDYLAAADVCLCLRWPTALETSASWLRCLAAARPTVISDLAHLVDIPVGVARRIDLLDEDAALRQTMRELAADAGAREALARQGHAYWAAGHTLEVMAGDYRRTLANAAAQPAPVVPDLPAHFTDDYGGRARQIARAFGLPNDSR